MDNRSNILMLSGVVFGCADCGDERIFMPVGGDNGVAGEFCCTSCDAAVFLVDVLGDTATTAGPRSKVA